MAYSKSLLTKFSINHRLKSCVPRNKIVLVTTYLEMSVCDELLEDELQDEDEENPDEVEEAVEAEE